MSKMKLWYWRIFYFKATLKASLRRTACRLTGGHRYDLEVHAYRSGTSLVMCTRCKCHAINVRWSTRIFSMAKVQPAHMRNRPLSFALVEVLVALAVFVAMLALALALACLA